jgi:hypothetical protein
VEELRLYVINLNLGLSKQFGSGRYLSSWVELLHRAIFEVAPPKEVAGSIMVVADMMI